MMTTLTLSVPEDILLSAQMAALKRGTSVQAICIDALNRLIGPDDAVVAAIDRADAMADEFQFHLLPEPGSNGSNGSNAQTQP